MKRFMAREILLVALLCAITAALLAFVCLVPLFDERVPIYENIWLGREGSKKVFQYWKDARTLADKYGDAPGFIIFGMGGLYVAIWFKRLIQWAWRNK